MLLSIMSWKTTMEVRHPLAVISTFRLSGDLPMRICWFISVNVWWTIYWTRLTIVTYHSIYVSIGILVALMIHSPYINLRTGKRLKEEEMQWQEAQRRREAQQIYLNAKVCHFNLYSPTTTSRYSIMSMYVGLSVIFIPNQ